MPSANLYVDQNGKSIKPGRYIYKARANKFSAVCKYPEGYTKSKICYTMDEAVTFLTDEYEKYAPGWYYNNDMEMVFLRRPNDPRPERLY